ncbi:MAG: hypothetical protein PHG06_22175 [Parabacteroides sp.]|nr:hypothetical protein [Parabacteroides sp.]
MERHGVKWFTKDTHKEHLSVLVLDYRKQERTKEVEKLNKTIAEKKAASAIASKARVHSNRI